MISFHAKGSPANGLGHVRMGIQNQLAAINAGFRTVASRPETAKLPVVIGESDPDGCAACQSYGGLYPNLAYRNGSIFAAYTIEQLVRTLDTAQKTNVNVRGAVTWAFEFEDQPIFGGFRSLATDGVALPVLNTFRMLNKMGTKRLAVTSTGDLGLDAIRMSGVRGAKSDVHALAARDEKRITIISWNYHDDELPGPDADVMMNITGLPADATKVKLTEWRVDDAHSNSFTAWKAMGSPAKPTPEQHQKIEAASELEMTRQSPDVAVGGGKMMLKLNLPRQAVSLVELAW